MEKEERGTEEQPRGEGPLAEVPMGGPIDDPAMADRANPRWDDPTSPEPDAQPLTGPGGTPNVLPQTPASARPPIPGAQVDELEDQAARDLDENLRGRLAPLAEKLAETQREYDRQTDHGRQPQPQAQWRRRQAEELAELEQALEGYQRFGLE